MDLQDYSSPTREMLDKRVTIVEVGARDGLQNVKAHIPTQTKLELISRLRACGLTSIELTSVVSPRAVPQLSDCRQLLASEQVQALLADNKLSLPVLVPNLKGLQIALDHHVREVAVFLSASDGFSQANINCSVDDSLLRAADVVREARRGGATIRGYVSCVFADPFDGPTETDAVVRVVRQLLDLGCYQVSLGDTLGVGNPAQVATLFAALLDSGIPSTALAAHFHDTYGQALANVWQAYHHGIRVFDSSVAGLGGCPYCPGARGNVATEDLVYSFESAGISTGVDLDKLSDTGDWISAKLGMSNGSRAGQALMSTRVQQASTEGPAYQYETEESGLHAAAASNDSTLSRAEGNLRALWRICRFLWQTQHQATVPGT